MAANATSIEGLQGVSVAEVATLWSDNILNVTQLGYGKGEQRRFVVGEETSCDCWVQPEVIGEVTRLDLVSTTDDAVVLHLPAGAAVTLERPEMTITDRQQLLELGLARPAAVGALDLTVEEGWVAQVTLGETSFRVRRTNAGLLEKAPAVVDWSSLSLTGASFLVHAVFLALVFAIPPEPNSISLDGITAGNRFVSYLVAPPEIDRPEVPDFLEQAAQPEQPQEANPGSAHQGDPGMMGDRSSTQRGNHYAIRNRGGDQVTLGREELRDYATNGGILAALRSNAPTSPFVTTTANGFDAEDALGALIGNQPGNSFGYGGLSLFGTQRGGGGRDGIVSLGTSLNTIGRVGNPTQSGTYGRDRGQLQSRRSGGPVVRTGVASVAGSLSSEVIRRQIRLQRNSITHCYQTELNSRPDLEGRVTITFLIDAQGRVISSNVSDSTVGSPSVGQCVANVIRRISFPAPGNGVVRVHYPFTFVAND